MFHSSVYFLKVFAVREVVRYSRRRQDPRQGGSRGEAEGEVRVPRLLQCLLRT